MVYRIDALERSRKTPIVYLSSSKAFDILSVRFSKASSVDLFLRKPY